MLIRIRLLHKNINCVVFYLSYYSTTAKIYTLSLHDALPISNTLFSVGKVPGLPADFAVGAGGTILHYDGMSWTAQASGTTHDLSFVTVLDRKSTRLNSSHMSISYAVFCLKKKNQC